MPIVYLPPSRRCQPAAEPLVNLRVAAYPAGIGRAVIPVMCSLACGELIRQARLPSEPCACDRPPRAYYFAAQIAGVVAPASKGSGDCTQRVDGKEIRGRATAPLAPPARHPAERNPRRRRAGIRPEWLQAGHPRG